MHPRWSPAVAECAMRILRLQGASLGVDLALPFHVLAPGSVFGGLPVVLNKSSINFQGTPRGSGNSKLRKGNVAWESQGSLLNTRIPQFPHPTWLWLGGTAVGPQESARSLSWPGDSAIHPGMGTTVLTSVEWLGMEPWLPDWPPFSSLFLGLSSTPCVWACSQEHAVSRRSRCLTHPPRNERHPHTPLPPQFWGFIKFYVSG